MSLKKCPSCGKVSMVDEGTMEDICPYCGEFFSESKGGLVSAKPAKAPSASENQPGWRKSPAQKVSDMFTLCSSEREFLGLRERIMQMDTADEEKVLMLNALDQATKTRLADVMEDAAEYETKKKEKMGLGALIITCIVIAGIGFYFWGTTGGLIASGC